MNKLVKTTAIIAAAAALLAGCGDDKETPRTPAAPTIEMVGANIDDVHEIAAQMSVEVAVAAEAGIARFDITIESPMLTDEFLKGVGLAAQMELVTAPSGMAAMLKNFGFPVGSEVKDAKTLAFDISDLVPLIAQLGKKTSNHNFVLKVTDAKGQNVTETLKFHLTGTSSVAYNNDADLWANTATLTVNLAEAAQDAALEYRIEGETTWQQASPLTANQDGSYKATIAPAWVAAADHASGAKLFTLDNKTGVFAGKKYEYRVVADGTAVEGTEGRFDAGAVATIPGGNMETWKKTVLETWTGTADSYAPTAEDGTAFWSSGNNLMTPALCAPDTLSVNSHAAKLQGVAAMGAIFAAGNLFTGIFDFDMDSYNGYARFGQQYAFKARPTALRLRYKAKVAKYTHLGLKDGQAGAPTKEDIDRGRIFVCITDWSDRHSVMSGLGVMGDPSLINGFDPETDARTDEGKIIAYGSKWIDASTQAWEELTIPILYLDKDAKPAEGNYSLVISSAASALGDYLCGSTDNQLCVDDFEWVY